MIEKRYSPIYVNKWPRRASHRSPDNSSVSFCFLLASLAFFVLGAMGSTGSSATATTASFAALGATSPPNSGSVSGTAAFGLLPSGLAGYSAWVVPFLGNRGFGSGLISRGFDPSFLGDD